MSQPVTFEPGTQYVLQGVSYQVTQLLDDGTLVALNLTSNTSVSHHLDLLWQHWQDNTLQFARSGPNLRDIAGTTLKTTYVFADLADLPPKLQEITWHRYQLIRPLVDLPSRQRTKQVVQERIRTYLSSLEQERAKGVEHAFLFGLRVGRGTSPSPRPDQTTKERLGDQVPITDPPVPDAHLQNLQLADQDPCRTGSGEPPRLPIHTHDHLGTHRLSTSLQPLLDLTPRTVSRWLRRYQISHQDIRSLVPSFICAQLR